MKSAARAYSDAIVSAMREAGVYEAITTGQPSEISFSVAFGAAIARCELGLGTFKTPEERASAVKRCYDEALEQLIAADKAGTRKAEAMKVAICPSCNLWFSSFKARNQHREEEHSAAAAARRIAAEDDAEVAAAISADRNPASEQLVVLNPDLSVNHDLSAARRLLAERGRHEPVIVLAPSPAEDAPITMMDF